MQIKMSPLPITLEKEFRKLAVALSRRGEPHAAVGKYLKRRMRARFTYGKDADGTKWQPLAAATIRTRWKKGIAGIKPLIATGKLKSQVNYQLIDIGKSGFISKHIPKNETITRVSAERLGTRNVKARVHQGRGLGTKVRNIPARPYVGMNETEKRKVRDIFMKWINIEASKTVVKIRAKTAPGV